MTTRQARQHNSNVLYIHRYQPILMTSVYTTNLKVIVLLFSSSLINPTPLQSISQPLIKYFREKEKERKLVQFTICFHTWGCGAWLEQNVLRGNDTKCVKNDWCWYLRGGGGHKIFNRKIPQTTSYYTVPLVSVRLYIVLA